MDLMQKRLIESYQRVKNFLGKHPATTPGFAEGKALIDAVVERLAELSSAQVFGLQLSQAGRISIGRACRRLRHHHLKPIVTIAKAEIEGDPAIAKALRMPPSNAGPVALLAAARALRDAAGLYQPTFVRFGRPQDFLEQLNAAMQAVEDAMSVHAGSYGTRIGARAGMEQELRRGRRAVEILDPIVQIAYEGNNLVLAEWRSARRVRGVASVAPEPAAVEEAPVVSSAAGGSAAAA